MKGALLAIMTLSTLSYITIVITLGFSNATPAAAFSLSEWLQNPYSKGGTVQEQIQCYTMPYGGIGFLSHVLTYLTVAGLAFGRSPLLPWRHLAHKRFNILMASAGLMATVVLAALSIARCRQTWPLLLIAVWKLILSITLSAMTIHAAIEIQETGLYVYRREKGNFLRILWWLILYVIGTIVGLAGVGKLARDHFAENQQLRTVTFVFMSIVVAVPGIALLIGIGIVLQSCCSDSSKREEYPMVRSSTPGVTRSSRPRNRSPSPSGADAIWPAGISIAVGIGIAVVLIGALFAFYTDWALATLTGDMAGTPSSDNAIFYWIYFAAKRFPLFSF